MDEESLIINGLFMACCSVLLILIVIGIALYYSGFVQRKSSFSMMAIPFIIFPIIIIDWYIWSYSLCYSSSSNHFIGSLDFAVLRHLKDPTSSKYVTSRGEILSVIHFLFNGLMKLVCASLTFPGCVAERGRLFPMLVFMFFWGLIIYNPVTYWFWNRDGWLSVELKRLPVLDFAGGNCIHIVSGFTTLAYSYILGPRNPALLTEYRNSSGGYIILGTFFILLGWCGFLVGCDYKFSSKSIYIAINIMLCSSTSAITWCLIDYYYSIEPEFDKDTQLETIWTGTTITNVIPKIRDLLRLKKRRSGRRRRLSMISFSSGIITGLVVLTPGGGYVSSSKDIWKSFVYGVVGASVTNLSTRLKYILHTDDALDIFAIHGVAGIVGSILTGIFASRSFQASGGWVAGHWKQLGYQILGCVVVSAYVFTLSVVILYVIDVVPGLHLRIDRNFNRIQRERKKEAKIENSFNEGELSSDSMHDEAGLELMGTDAYYFGNEFTMDYMEFSREISYQGQPCDDLINENRLHDNKWVNNNNLELRAFNSEVVNRQH